jgi:ABC-type branched-subunit amino acid transport system substrate-binding protein
LSVVSPSAASAPPGAAAPAWAFAGRLVLALLLLAPAACAPQPPPRPRAAPALGPGYATLRPPVQAAPAEVPRARVGVLLPLSGGNRALGQAMLNAAQLALFDQADSGVELLPRDTGGSPSGAMDATRGALTEGARAFAGPLTLGETAAAAGVARAAAAPLIALTSDSAQAAPGVWVLGLTPREQADRVVGAAIAAGARRFGLIAPNDGFGRRLDEALRLALIGAGLPPPTVVLHGIRADAAQSARDLAAAAGAEGLDAVLLGEGGANAKSAATALAEALPRPARLLGTAIWLADATLGQEPALQGAWFAAPDPSARLRFESRYQTAFGARPPPLASLAYDAAALSLRALRDGNGTPPIGTALLGADGPIRLTADGQARRGLALLALDPGGEPLLIEPAPLPPGAADS